MHTLIPILLTLCGLLGCSVARVPPPLPELRIQIDGPLSAADVQETFHAYRNEFKQLLKGSSAPGSRRAGEIVLSFEVSATGWVRDLQIVRGDVTDTKFRDEVLVQIGLMRFPERSELTRIKNYPLSFLNQNR